MKMLKMTDEGVRGGPVLDTFLMPVDMVQESLPFFLTVFYQLLHVKGINQQIYLPTRHVKHLHFQIIFQMAKIH